MVGAGRGITRHTNDGLAVLPGDRAGRGGSVRQALERDVVRVGVAGLLAGRRPDADALADAPPPLLTMLSSRKPIRSLCIRSRDRRSPPSTTQDAGQDSIGSVEGACRLKKSSEGSEEGRSLGTVWRLVSRMMAGKMAAERGSRPGTQSARGL